MGKCSSWGTGGVWCRSASNNYRYSVHFVSYLPLATLRIQHKNCLLDKFTVQAELLQCCSEPETDPCWPLHQLQASSALVSHTSSPNLRKEGNTRSRRAIGNLINNQKENQLTVINKVILQPVTFICPHAYMWGGQNDMNIFTIWYSPAKQSFWFFTFLCQKDYLLRCIFETIFFGAVALDSLLFPPNPISYRKLFLCLWVVAPLFFKKIICRKFQSVCLSWI